MDIGRSIKKTLVDKEWSRVYLAGQLGITRQAVNNLCNNGSCSTNRLAQLAGVFGMKVSEFIAVGEIND